MNAAISHVSYQTDHSAPCAVLAVDVRDILEGRRDPKTDATTATRSTR